jgi:hypothetical protein
MEAELSAFLGSNPLGSLPRLAIRTTEQLTGFFITDALKSLRVTAQGPPRFHGEVRKNTTRRGDVALFDASDWTATLVNGGKEIEHVAGRKLLLRPLKRWVESWSRKQSFPLLKGLGLRVNPPSFQGAGNPPHLEMPGSAGGKYEPPSSQFTAPRVASLPQTPVRGRSRRMGHRDGVQ